MTDKLSARFSAKNWIAYVLFGIIIAFFVLSGLNQQQFGQTTGGVAAVVNDSSISLNEYRSRVESIEQNARARFDQFPEAQRRALSQQLRSRALEELILGEVVFQAASRKGVMASDGEVRDYILQIPFLQENGRFLRERYRMFLQNMNLTSDDFERQIRKQIVTQRVQELFVGAASPTREELRRNRLLANQKVGLRYAEISKQDLAKLVTDADVQAFAASNQADIEKYYNDNKVEFSKPERVKARHILVRISDQRTEAQASKMAAELRKQVTPQNFAGLAAKSSDDPGSKTKGGDLGEFERGKMLPEFEKVAFELTPGQISDPIKTDFGYHIIYVENKVAAEVDALTKVQAQIARKLLMRNKEADVLASLRKPAEAGDKKQVDAVLSRAGVKWQDAGEFDLSSSTIPKLGEAPALMRAILKRGKQGGFVPQLVETQGGASYVVAEVVSWKEVPDKTEEVEGLERMVAFRKSSDLIESWSKEVESKASIQRNPRLMQQ